jgi:hypothetical protein
LVEAVRPVALRRTKNAARSLAARVEDVTDDDVTDALDDGRLVAFYGPRGTVVMAPPADVPVFTAGAAPDGEASLRAALPGVFVRRLDQAGVTATDALAAVAEATWSVLADGPLPRGETAIAVTRLVPEALTPPCRGRCPDSHVEDSLFRLTGVRFYRSEDVLVAPEAPRPGRPWRTEFVRRYLSCYGPSTTKALAAWAGIGNADARASLEELSGEVTETFVDGQKAGGPSHLRRRKAGHRRCAGRALPSSLRPLLGGPGSLAARAFTGSAESGVASGGEPRCGPRGRGACGHLARRQGDSL